MVRDDRLRDSSRTEGAGRAGTALGLRREALLARLQEVDQLVLRGALRRKLSALRRKLSGVPDQLLLGPLQHPPAALQLLRRDARGSRIVTP
jgi:hypothetical protein